jgi:ribosome-associated heat shock protein Hsp15
VSGGASLRLDKWLVHARFVKTRERAQDLIENTRIRVNRVVVEKAAHPVRPGDLITLPLGPGIRVLRVLALGERRGPATEARTLYEEIDFTAEGGG